jgi:hypothetical protein
MHMCPLTLLLAVHCSATPFSGSSAWQQLQALDCRHRPYRGGDPSIIDANYGGLGSISSRSRRPVRSAQGRPEARLRQQGGACAAATCFAHGQQAPKGSV